MPTKACPGKHNAPLIVVFNRYFDEALAADTDVDGLLGACRVAFIQVI